MKVPPLLRMLALAGCLALLLRHTGPLKAQIFETCIKQYETDFNYICCNQCSNQGGVTQVVGVSNSNPGRSSVSTQYVNCGSPAKNSLCVCPPSVGYYQ